MQRHSAMSRFWLSASLLAVILIAGLILRATALTHQADQATSQRGQFTGQVLSASGALVVGGVAANPGHPVAGATIHLVPVTGDALESFPAGRRLRAWNAPRAGGPRRWQERRQVQAPSIGDARLPIVTTYADVYLWRNARDNKYFITLVNRLNAQDPNSPAHLEIKLLYGGAVHDQRYIVSVPPGLGDRPGWYTVLRGMPPTGAPPLPTFPSVSNADFVRELLDTGVTANPRGRFPIVAYAAFEGRTP